MSVGNPDKENTGEPFMAQCMGHAEQSGVGMTVFGTTSTLDTHSVVINGEGSVTKAIEEKYIPDTIARKSDLDASITNITNGDIVVKEAEHATSADSAITADSATSAESATKATQDGNGAVIADTYETKADASAKLDEAKEYTDTLKTYVGTIPEGATATDVVGYIQEKTSGIASEGAMTELSNRVGIVEGKVATIEGDYLTSADKTELQNNIDTVSSAVELLTNGVDAETVDGVNDLIAYVNEHGTEVTGMKADIKANADTLAELAPVAKTGSWNELEDKPFGESGESVEITWDGDYTTNPENYISVFEDVINETFYTKQGFYYVSDYIPSHEELQSASCVRTMDAPRYGGISSEEFLVGNDITQVGEDIFDVCNGQIIVARKENIEYNSVTYSKSGIYFYLSDDGAEYNSTKLFISAMTIPGAVKTLDEKYIPSSIARVSDIPVVDLTPYETKEDASAKLTEAKAYVDEKFDGHVHSWNELEDKPFGEEGSGVTIEWDGNTEGKVGAYLLGESMGMYYKVSDETLSYEDFIGSTITYRGTSVELTEDIAPQIVAQGNGAVQFGTHILAIANTTFELPNIEGTFTAPSTGLYFTESMYAGDGISYGGSTTIKTLDEKYIPASIARTADLDALASRVNTAESDIDALEGNFNSVSTAFGEYKDAHAGDYTNTQIDAAIKVVADNVAALNDTYASDEELAQAIEDAKTDSSNKDAVVLAEAQKGITALDTRIVALESWHENFEECTAEDINALFA
jgi:hypothetical protein